jgi:endonuclease IV
MSKSIKEMVQSLHRSDEKQVTPQSTAQRQTYQGATTSEQKRQCYQKAMHSINDIEQQIQQIMHIIPTISDINKKTGLISSISPVLEKALNELII